MLYRDQLRLTFRYLGFPDPNWKKFTKEPFALDWYDTTEANRILRYQNRTFDDYLTELRRGLGFKYQLFRYGAAPLMQLLRIHL